MSNENDSQVPEFMWVIMLVLLITIVAIPIAIMYFVGRRVPQITRLRSTAYAIVSGIVFYNFGPAMVKAIGGNIHPDDLILIVAITGVISFVANCIFEEPRAVFGLPLAAPDQAYSEPEHQDWSKTHQDDGFDFNSSRFKSGGPESTKEMPYGVDKRHPDDAKFWAYVDDPNASDQERKIAFEKILTAQAKRKGKKKTDIVGLQ